MKTSFKKWIALAAAGAAAIIAPLTFAASDADSAAGKAILKKYSETLVGVELVLVTKGGRGGGTQEIKREVSGTVIAANGMTVVSLVTLDQGRAAAGRGADSATEFKEVKMRLADNTEIPAAVVLKDAELDIAFIVPTGEGATKTYPFLNLGEATEPNILGTYFEIGRLNKLLQRVAVVNTVTVIGTIDRPRKVILLEDDATLGSPVFDQQGKLLGLGFCFVINGSLARQVLVPPGDIADLAKQAVAAREAELPMALPGGK